MALESQINKWKDALLSLAARKQIRLQRVKQLEYEASP